MHVIFLHCTIYLDMKTICNFASSILCKIPRSAFASIDSLLSSYKWSLLVPSLILGYLVRCPVLYTVTLWDCTLQIFLLVV